MGASLDLQNSAGSQTALTWAAGQNQLEAVGLLLDLGADINVVTSTGVHACSLPRGDAKRNVACGNRYYRIDRGSVLGPYQGCAPVDSQGCERERRNPIWACPVARSMQPNEYACRKGQCCAHVTESARSVDQRLLPQLLLQGQANPDQENAFG